MKKRKCICLLCFVVLILVLGGCKHQHVYSETWAYDENNHYHQATCHESIKKDIESHIFNDWVVEKEATETEEGLKTRECSVCHYKESELIDKVIHQHVYSETWAYDDNNHWHQATCHESVKKDIGAHTYQDGECSVCHASIFGFTLNEDEKEYTITSIKDVSIQSVRIPKEFNQMPVTKIAPNLFKNCSQLTTVIMEDGIEFIGEEAFSSCKLLRNVTFSNTLKSIGKFAFYGCTSLENIQLPESLTSIEEGAFQECSKLKKIILPSQITKVSKNLFRLCSLLETVEFKGEIITIEEYAFWYCTELKNITLPSTLETIGQEAFYCCSSLENIIVPDLITSLENELFSGCSSLESITLPKNIQTIGESVFFNCNLLNHVYYKGTINDWCQISFGTTGASYSDLVTSNPMSKASFFYILENDQWKEVTELQINEGITKIGDLQFYGFSHVNSVLFPESLESIGYSSFQNCESILSLQLGNHVKSIDQNAFKDCFQMNTFEFTSSTIYFENDVFQGCDLLEKVIYDGTIEDWCNIQFVNEESTPMSHALQFYLKNTEEEITEIVLPNNISEIGNYQFYGFKNITKLDIPSYIHSIGRKAFEQCNQLEYNEYDNGRYLGNQDNPYVVLISVLNSNETQMKISSDICLISEGVLDSCNRLEYYVYNEGKYLGNDDNKTIVFMGTTSDAISSISLSETTKIIYDKAFSNAFGLSEIELPASLTSVGNDAFYDCFHLETIRYHGDLSQWCQIGFSETTSNPMCHNGHFYQKENNEWKEITTLVIPEGIKNIGNYQFYYFTQITKVQLPSTIERIGEYSFGVCTNLKEITINEGTKVLGSLCFTGCSSLSSVVLPATLEKINERAFNLNSSLSKIYYKGIVDQWNQVSISSNNTELLKATIYYYSLNNPSNDGHYWYYDQNNITEW